MEDDQSYPPISNALLERLERAFPVVPPVPKIPIEAIMYNAGMRHVVDTLRRVQGEQRREET